MPAARRACALTAKIPPVLPVLVVLLVLSGAPVMAAGEGDQGDPSDQAVQIVINGEHIPLSIAPLVHEGRVFVPLRPLFEALWAEIEYHDGAVYGVRGSRSLYLEIGTGTARVAGNEVQLDAPPFIIAGRAYVPVRFVAQSLGDHVDWQPDSRTVAIRSEFVQRLGPAVADAEQRTARVPYTEEEFEWLVRVINAEAYDEPYEGMVAVGCVVVNRVLHPSFPGTVMEVLFAPGQFKVIQNGQVNRALRPEAYQAAMDALYGPDLSLGALYFFNPDVSRNSFLHSLTPTVTIGRHRFAR